MDTPYNPPVFTGHTSESFNRRQVFFSNRPTVSIVFGITSVILGIYALFHFVAMSFISVIVLGSLLILSALMYGIHMFMEQQWRTAVVDLLTAVLFAVTGIFVLRQPISALGAITIVVGGFYAANGIIRTIASLTIRPAHWGWMLADGVLSTIVGGLILASWPSSAFWLIGFILGLNLILNGCSMITAGLVVQRMRRRPRKNINMSHPAMS